MDDSPAPGIPTLDTARLLDRPVGLMVEAAMLQQEIRSMLTPALLSVDMLLTHTDPVVARHAEILIRAIIRVVDRAG